MKNSESKKQELYKDNRKTLRILFLSVYFKIKIILFVILTAFIIFMYVSIYIFI